MKPRLITIPLSHYAERARWALDEAGVDYVEDQHLQLFAGRVTRRHGARHTVPALVLEDRVLSDSRDIVQWAAHKSDDRLYPAAVERREVEALEAELADEFGIETRRIAYDWFFRNLDSCIDYNSGAAPGYQVMLLKLGRRAVVPNMKRYLGLTPDKLDSGRRVVRDTMDAIAERIADGRPYLFGDMFSAADLTFAAMAAPAVLPEQYPVSFPPLDLMDPGARNWAEEMKAHPAGRFALQLYEQRPPSTGRLTRTLRRP